MQARLRARACNTRGRALALLVKPPCPPILRSIRVKPFLSACTMHGTADNAASTGRASLQAGVYFISYRQAEDPSKRQTLKPEVHVPPGF